jgi:outer membrane protein insertion porin family
MLMLGDKNLGGTGDSVNIRWEFGGVDNKNYDLSYRHPWLDKKGTAFGINLYDATHEYEELDDFGNKLDYYERKRKGVDFYFSRPVNDQITDSISFKFRDDLYVRPVGGETTGWYDGRNNSGDDPAMVARARRADAFGKTHSITLARSIDKRDNIYNPSRGQFAQISSEFAGLIGGDFDFNKYTLEGRAYYPQGKNVMAFRAAVGYATGKMPVSQRFALGGDSYLRGYKDDRFYGYKMLSATGEYRMPIAKNFQGVAFIDAGYVWDKGASINLNDVEYGYGVGLRINSPLGPIRLDYAHGDRWRLHFSFGAQF